MRRRSVTVNDQMQRGYAYELTEPAGRNFSPEFRPELTPKQMLQLGVFGGKYLTDCRYYMGRRCPDDERQIRRWRAVRRHVVQLQRACSRGDFSCRPRQRQALLHWAYDARLI